MRSIALSLLLALAGCGTTGSATRMSAGVELQPPPTPTSDARAAYDAATQALQSGDEKTALAGYDKAISLQPDFFEALNDKAWLLATSNDDTIRNPTDALTFANRAFDTLAAAGMLRKDRDAFAEQHSTGRAITAMSTVAAALAAQGHFVTQPGLVTPSMTAARAAGVQLSAAEQAVAADCDSSDGAVAAASVQMFVVQSSQTMDAQFNTPTTHDMVSRAQQLLDLYRAGKPATGQRQLVSSTSPVMQLR